MSSTRNYKLVAFTTKLILFMNLYILVIHYIVLNSFAWKLLRNSPFTLYLKLIKKILSQNCIEIYVHFYILQVIKYQLIKTCTCSYNIRTRTCTRFQSQPLYFHEKSSLGLHCVDTWRSLLQKTIHVCRNLSLTSLIINVVFLLF